MAVTLIERHRRTQAERALRGQARTVFQQQRRPGLVVPRADPIVPEDCGRELYDFYLTHRKGQPCWQGDNVFDTAQAMWDHANLTSLQGGGTPDRGYTCWVDPAPPLLAAPGSNTYGDMIADTTASLPLSMISIGGGDIFTGFNGARLGKIHWNDSPYFVLELENITVDSIDITLQVCWLKTKNCQIGPVTNTMLGSFAELHCSAFKSRFGDIVLTADPSLANNGFLGDSVFDQCILDKIFIDGTFDAEFISCYIEDWTSGTLDRVRMDGIIAQRVTTVGGIDAWMHILSVYEESQLLNIIFHRETFSAGPVDALINMDLIVTANPLQDSTELVVANCALNSIEGGGAPPWRDQYIVQKTGPGEAERLVLQDCTNASTQAKGAIGGPFTKAVFGPNTPNSLDYSGVTGTGNKIWQ